MPKKRIHLTEGQLHRLIEQSINEISTQTKMSASNKANREMDDYWEKYKNPGDTDPMRAIEMLGKRLRQKEAFKNAVETDMNDLNGVGGANFSPSNRINDKLGFDQRGSMEIYRSPRGFGSRGTFLYPVKDPDEKRSDKYKDVEEFLNGNSYYEKGRGWVNPYDKGYDKKKSEPWSMIKRPWWESVAHRVTESVMRMLKEGADDTGWTCEEFNTGDYSFYIIDNAWIDYSAEELTKILEQIIIWHIESSEKDDVDNYAEGCSDEGAYLFIKAQDENPNDGSEYKGYPLYIHACYDLVSGPERDNGWKWWSSGITNMTPENNEVRVEFADGENDPRTELVSQAVANIDWNKIMKSVEIYEGHEEEDNDYDPDDDFDYWEDKRYSRMGY